MLGICVACLAVVGVLVHFFEDIMSDAVAMLTIFVGIVCGLGALFSGLGFIAVNADRATCIEQGEKTGMNVRYEFLSVCYVRVDGHLVPYDRWIQVSGVGTP